MIKFVTLIIVFSLFVCSPVEGQKTTAQKIQEDTLTINDMLDDLEGYKMVDDLKEIFMEYKDYWNSNIRPPNEDDLKDFYVTIGEKLLEFAPVYDADFKSNLIDLKNSYEGIESSPKELKKLRKDFKNLKKAHEKNKPNNIDKIKIANLIRQYEKAGGRRDISVGDILRKGGQLILTLDEYADNFGKLDNLSDAQIDSLKTDPVAFISQKTDEHIEKYRRLKDSLSVVEIQTDLLQDYQTIISELNDSIERENKKFSQENTTLLSVKKSVENELLVSTNRQNQLNQELMQIRSRLSKYEQDLQAKINERDGLSEDMEELRAKLKLTTSDFESSYKELEKLQTASIQLRTDTANLQAAKAKIEKEKQTLFDEKESAENGRLIFLISSLVLFLGLLGYLFSEQWRVRKENKALSEEKALLEKNIEYTEGFYEEYRKASKAQIAIERKKLKKQNVVMLRELNHRTKNNLQMISSILGIQAMSIDDKKAKEVLINSKSRIHAIGLIHKGMYTEAFEDQVQVMMKNYVNNLVNSLKKSFQFEAEVTINNEVENIFIPPDKALPIGLIINEVVTNAFKHAFRGQPSPTLNIVLKHKGENELYVSVQDNGNGMNKDQTTKKSFGLKMIDLLIHELEGKYMFKNDNGLKFIMTFPVQYTLKNST